MANFDQAELAIIRELIEHRLESNDRLDKASGGQAKPVPSTITLAVLLSKVAMATDDRRTPRRHAVNTQEETRLLGIAELMERPETD